MGVNFKKITFNKKLLILFKLSGAVLIWICYSLIPESLNRIKQLLYQRQFLSSHPLIEMAFSIVVVLLLIIILSFTDLYIDSMLILDT